MSPPHRARLSSLRTRARRHWKAFHRHLRRSRKGILWAWRKLNAAPPAIRVALIAAMVLAGFSATNIAYQVVRKPSEMLFPIGNALDKAPTETWRQHGAFFREYSTANITAELLAALAQVESAGNPVART